MDDRTALIIVAANDKEYVGWDVLTQRWLIEETKGKPVYENGEEVKPLDICNYVYSGENNFVKKECEIKGLDLRALLVCDSLNVCKRGKVFILPARNVKVKRDDDNNDRLEVAFETRLTNYYDDIDEDGYEFERGYETYGKESLYCRRNTLGDEVKEEYDECILVIGRRENTFCCDRKEEFEVIGVIDRDFSYIKHQKSKMRLKYSERVAAFSEGVVDEEKKQAISRICKYPEVLRVLPDKLRNDLDIVRIAIDHDALTYRFAGDAARYDDTIIKYALEESEYVARYIPSEKKDEFKDLIRERMANSIIMAVAYKNSHTDGILHGTPAIFRDILQHYLESGYMSVVVSSLDFSMPFRQFMSYLYTVDYQGDITVPDKIIKQPYKKTMYPTELIGVSELGADRAMTVCRYYYSLLGSKSVYLVNERNAGDYRFDCFRSFSYGHGKVHTSTYYADYLDTVVVDGEIIWDEDRGLRVFSKDGVLDESFITKAELITLSQKYPQYISFEKVNFGNCMKAFEEISERCR